jgi:DNA-binding IclR family transcriptional regulator
MQVTASKTVSKALGLLNLVAERPGLSLTELGRAAGLPTATAHRLLKGLQAEGLLRLDSARRYHLGAGCLTLGARFLEHVDVRLEARPLLEDLVEATGETTHLGIPDGTEILYVDKVDSRHSVRMYSRIGVRSPMHSTAMGKAILAFADAALLERVIAQGLPRRTPNTITSGAALRAQLERVREQRYAIDDIENEDGIRCVAAPVLAGRQHPLAAISVSGPVQRMTDDKLTKIAHAVMQAADEVALRTGYREEDRS